MPSEQMRYVWYAERYQWTPEQVDNLPAWVEPWVPQIANLLDEIKAARQKKDEESHRSRFSFRRR